MFDPDHVNKVYLLMRGDKFLHLVRENLVTLLLDDKLLPSREKEGPVRAHHFVIAHIPGVEDTVFRNRLRCFFRKVVVTLKDNGPVHADLADLAVGQLLPGPAIGLHRFTHGHRGQFVEGSTNLPGHLFNRNPRRGKGVEAGRLGHPHARAETRSHFSHLF